MSKDGQGVLVLASLACAVVGGMVGMAVGGVRRVEGATSLRAVG